MKISGKEVAEGILKKLKQEIQTANAEQKNNLKPGLAIILAGEDPSSRIYVNSKIKTARKIGIDVRLFEFSKDEKEKVLKTIQRLNNNKDVHGIIIQYPVYENWNFEELAQNINPKKDVDGFLKDSPFRGATALGVWEMLKAFASIEGFKNVEDFLKDKNVVLLGKGRTAGGPTRNLLTEKGINFTLIDSKTENPNQIIKNADVIISATGKKNIINGSNTKIGAYVIGVGVGKEGGQVYGDINEEEVSKVAKLYCPTIGGIGPLTVACLLRNVVESSKKEKVKSKNAENL